MAPIGYRNVSLTTDADLALKALTTQVADHLGRPVSYSDVIRIAVDILGNMITIGAVSAFDNAARRVFNEVTVNELTRRLGLPEHEAGNVGAWTGAPWGTTWTEAEADELVDAWANTCDRHGVHGCRAAECAESWTKGSA